MHFPNVSRELGLCILCSISCLKKTVLQHCKWGLLCHGGRLSLGAEKRGCSSSMYMWAMIRRSLPLRKDILLFCTSSSSPSSSCLTEIFEHGLYIRRVILPCRDIWGHSGCAAKEKIRFLKL